ncbi:MAG TPA: glycogen-binding domain-containing protein [Polyangia bacterium]|nr:glycogen-binding domain-containing protein [Polyangia bacterium]
MWRRSQQGDSEVVDGLVEELGSLRDVHTPPALVARVMGDLTDRPAPSLLAWFQRPLRIVLRISPLGILGGTFSLALAGAMVVSTGRYPIPMTINGAEVPVGATSATTPAKVLVRFSYKPAGARRVAVAGSFNNWDPADIFLTSVNGGDLFTGTVALPAGEQEYMFVVDGNFVTDPNADEYRLDEFGGQNAVLRLAPAR